MKQEEEQAGATRRLDLPLKAAMVLLNVTFQSLSHEEAMKG